MLISIIDYKTIRTVESRSEVFKLFSSWVYFSGVWTKFEKNTWELSSGE